MRSRGKRSVSQPASASASASAPAPSPTERLGAAVRARRRALALNQGELAALAGVGLAFLYDLERGKPTLRIDKILVVLAVLGLQLEVCEGKQVLRVSAALEGQVR